MIIDYAEYGGALITDSHIPPLASPSSISILGLRFTFSLVAAHPLHKLKPLHELNHFGAFKSARGYLDVAG